MRPILPTPFNPTTKTFSNNRCRRTAKLQKPPTRLQSAKEFRPGTKSIVKEKLQGAGFNVGLNRLAELESLMDSLEREGYYYLSVFKLFDYSYVLMHKKSKQGEDIQDSNNIKLVLIPSNEQEENVRCLEFLPDWNSDSPEGIELTYERQSGRMIVTATTGAHQLTLMVPPNSEMAKQYPLYASLYQMNGAHVDSGQLDNGEVFQWGWIED